MVTAIGTAAEQVRRTARPYGRRRGRVTRSTSSSEPSPFASGERRTTRVATGRRRARTRRWSPRCGTDSRRGAPPFRPTRGPTAAVRHRRPSNRTSRRSRGKTPEAAFRNGCSVSRRSASSMWLTAENRRRPPNRPAPHSLILQRYDDRS